MANLKHQKKLKISTKTKRSIMLLTPALICISVVSLVPVLRGIMLGFTSYKVALPIRFNGIKNYISIWKNGYLKIATLHTIHIVVVSLAVTYVLGLIIALLLNSNIPLKKLWRSLLVIPWAVPAVAKSMTWERLFVANGWINYILIKTGLVKDNIAWLGQDFAIYAIITIIVWGCIPFTAMSFLAAMQSIPNEDYEAAELDGANVFQKFFYITMPYMRAISMVVVSLLFMWISNDFSSQYLLTQGGPGSSTLTMAVQSYYEGFRSGNFGMATSYGNMMMVFCGIFIFFYIRALRRKAD
jgi:multiple sugar transport system permease protein